MSKINSCQFNHDNACVELIYDNGKTLSIYISMIEEFLRTTVYSRSKLNWLIDNEPLEYARMVLDGTMQDYLDRIDDIGQEQMKSYVEKLTKHYPPNIAEDIAKEIMMYGG